MKLYLTGSTNISICKWVKNEYPDPYNSKIKITNKMRL